LDKGGFVLRGDEQGICLKFLGFCHRNFRLFACKKKMVICAEETPVFVRKSLFLNDCNNVHFSLENKGKQGIFSLLFLVKIL
jgi:hypothetical protein